MTAVVATKEDGSDDRTGKPPDRELPKTLNQKTMIKLLESEGWVRGKGTKHNVKMEKDGERPITLPQHHGQEYGKSLTSRILREAGIKGHARKGESGKAD